MNYQTDIVLKQYLLSAVNSQFYKVIWQWSTMNLLLYLTAEEFLWSCFTRHQLWLTRRMTSLGPTFHRFCGAPSGAQKKTKTKKNTKNRIKRTSNSSTTRQIISQTLAPINKPIKKHNQIQSTSWKQKTPKTHLVHDIDLKNTKLYQQTAIQFNKQQPN